jgi:hypothetical protein
MVSLDLADPHLVHVSMPTGGRLIFLLLAVDSAEAINAGADSMQLHLAQE